MRTRVWGYTGWKVPVVGQGTWQLEADDSGAAIAALRRGLDLGLTHVDTAELYGDGEVETLVARGDLGPARRGLPRLEGPPEERQRTGDTIARLRAIADAARHGPARSRTCSTGPAQHPLEDTIARVRGAGRATARSARWGVSNFDVDELEEAERIAGPGRDRLQPGALPPAGARRSRRGCCRGASARRIAVVGYSPFGSGRFPSPRARAARRSREIAEAHGATPRQVALAFLARDAVALRDPEGVERGAHRGQRQGGGARLSAEEQRAIDAAFPLRDAGGAAGDLSAPPRTGRRFRGRRRTRPASRSQRAPASATSAARGARSPRSRRRRAARR